MDNIIKAEDIMTKNVITVTPNTEVADAIKLLVDKKISGLPVLDDNAELVGIFSEKDVMKFIVEGSYHNLPDEKVGSFMTNVKQSIRPETDILTIAGIFMNGTFRRVPVVVGKKLVGIVSRHDVVKAIQQMRKSQKNIY